MTLALNGERDVRITKQNPATPWHTVWRNLHTVWTSEGVKAVRFMVINDLVQTNNRLAKTNHSDTNRCTLCEEPDNLIHRLTSCGEGNVIWQWTRAKIAAILRTDPRHVPPEWTIRPSFRLWPPQRHSAILWILAQGVLLHTAPESSIVHRICRLHAAYPLGNIPISAPPSKFGNYLVLL
jgi:hypothetical protein